MCGIAGILAYRDSGTVGERELLRLRDAQTHRGPDDAGHWISDDGRIGFGHRRLTIIDLSPLGRQPMTTPDGRFVIVFNGEIYNFRKLRDELEGIGHRFRSTSDTEVLLHGYQEWGVDVVERLRGMFAFAIHDNQRRETLLARDPLGIKPLYVRDDGARVAFASEVQALRGVLGAGGVDPEGLATFLMWGCIAPPLTLYRGIRAVPPGCWLRVGPRGIEGPTPFFRLEHEFGHAEAMDEEEAARRVREALVDSARHHLVADVPVGAFLSGGVDSSAVLGLLAEVHDGPLRAVTLSFDVAELDEAHLAARAAELYGAEHQVVPLRVEDARARIPDAIRALDQPSVDGVNSYFVSEAAVRAGLKVAVSGVGGDELFGGYDSFWRVPRIQRVRGWLAPLPGVAPIWAAAGRALGALPRTRVGIKLGLALRYGGTPAGAYYTDRGVYSPGEVRALLAPELAEAVDACDPARALAERVPVEGIDPEEHVSLFECRQYMQAELLRDIDAVSMRHSLEVRTPLVDRDLARALLRVPAARRRAGPAKRALREAPRPPVPTELWQRRKQGFVLPFDAWLRGGSLPLELPDHPWLRRQAMRRVVDHFQARRVHWSRVWALLVLREFLE